MGFTNSESYPVARAEGHLADAFNTLRGVRMTPREGDKLRSRLSDLSVQILHASQPDPRDEAKSGIVRALGDLMDQVKRL